MIADMLNRQCTQIASGVVSLFQRQFLVSPAKIVIANTTLLHSTQALLPRGTVFDSDLVWVGPSQSVGVVIGFWQTEGTTEIAIRLQMYEAVDADLKHWKKSDGVGTVNSEDIFDTVSYLDLGRDVVRVVPPIRAFVMPDES